MKTKIAKIIDSVHELESFHNIGREIDFLYFPIDIFERHDITLIKYSLPTSCKSICSIKNESINYKFPLHGVKHNGLIIKALKKFDFIELEYDSGINKSLLDSIPIEKRIICWRGKYTSKHSLLRLTKEILNIEAAYYIICPEISELEQGLSSMEILHSSCNEKLSLYCLGPLGLWTQIFSVQLGSPIIFCQDNVNNQAHFTLEKLIKDYNITNLRKVKKIFGIVGNPVYNSLSPRIHNQCYWYYGLENLYLPFHINKFEEFESLIYEHSRFATLGYELSGFTMVSPFKESAFQMAKKSLNQYSLLSKAANILLMREGAWLSDSSDGFAVLNILNSENINPQEISVAIFGCGGAGRTIAAILKSHGATVNLFNRSKERGIFASQMLDINYDALDQFEVNGYNVIINATPLGKNGEEPCFDLGEVTRDTIIIDMTYSKNETLLIEKARIFGIKTYSGKDVLLHQVNKQFKALTNLNTPKALVEELIHGETNLIEK